MANPYLPPKDADFNNWLLNFSTLITAAPTTYGLLAGDAVAIAAQNTAFAAAFTAATDPGTRGPATVAAKDAARVVAEAVIRPYAVRIASNPAVDDLDKVAVGVTVRSATRAPVPAPTTAPALMLTSAVPGVLNLQFRDATTPLVKAKPFGVIGAEVWVNFGTVPATDPAQCSYAGSYTKTPMQLDTTGNAGKVTTLFARWFNRSGNGGKSYVGPWSTSLVTYSV